MTTDIVAGGADWELGEAARKLTAALGAGDAGLIEQAMRDHAAAVGSKSTAMIAALFTPLMTGQAEQKRALDTLVDVMQHVSATVAKISTAQKKSDARLARLE